MIFQIINCADTSCKDVVCYLKYLDHYMEKHGNLENLGDGKIFKTPIDLDKVVKVKSVLVCSNRECGKANPMNRLFKKCADCNQMFWT